MMKPSTRNIITVCGLILLGSIACKRDKYYKDGGLAKADFPGTMLEYLDAHPEHFDSVAQVVRLAGLSDMFNKEDITFFAPDDQVILRTIGTIYTGGLNSYLYFRGRDTVRELSDIDSSIWRKYLLQYIFKGINRLKDYSQIDFTLLNIYPGGLYYTLGGNVMNIGVTFADANGIKYLGYRQLQLTYIPDISRPDEGWRTFAISSSDVKPKNGIVHALLTDGMYLGYDGDIFFNEIYNAGVK